MASRRHSLARARTDLANTPAAAETTHDANAHKSLSAAHIARVVGLRTKHLGRAHARIITLHAKSSAESAPQMKAIDLYSGVGGWSLGLKMAGVEVVESYEWWAPANETNRNNNRHKALDQDIRKLDPSVVPLVEIVVGSPPCTQFSFANRGGQGDIEDGLKDIYKFFEVVDKVQPQFWAMENVPRVAAILDTEMRPGGRLARFAHLADDMRIEVIKMEEFGVPQKRARCIAGNFDFDLLLSYRTKLEQRTLGDVIRALAEHEPVDPIYGLRPLAHGLIDHDLETPLDAEEERMNRDAKTHHPVYNNMPFPDPLDCPVRTITALCTRVSRESVVIRDDRKKGTYRRLSIRERAALQTFPIDFQFFGSSHQQKAKLIGNAVPPLMSFYIAQAMRGVTPGRLRSPSAALKGIKLASDVPKQTIPDRPRGQYKDSRKFRVALKGLRFKSGMRFDLSNGLDERTGATRWTVAFFFGNSKEIHELPLDDSAAAIIKRSSEVAPIKKPISLILSSLEKWLRSIDPELIQDVWARKANSPEHHPHYVADKLAEAAQEIATHLRQVDNLPLVLERVINFRMQCTASELAGWGKVEKNATQVLAGIVVAATANSALHRPNFPKAA